MIIENNNYTKHRKVILLQKYKNQKFDAFLSSTSHQENISGYTVLITVASVLADKPFSVSDIFGVTII
jgi:hypothetical protein